MMKTLSGCLGAVLCLVAPYLPAAEYEGVFLVAHRGAGFEVDENTIEACRHSYDLGYRGFEVDIRMTADGHLVLMHDATVKRTTGQEGATEQMSLGEIQALRTVRDGAKVPEIGELYAFFRDKDDVLIELEMKTSDKEVYPDEKVELYCQRLHEGVREQLAEGTYVFTSFDVRTLKIMRRLYPEAPLSLITGQPPTDEFLAQAKELGCERLAVVMNVTTRKFVREAQKAGLKVAGWPTRSLEDAQLAVALGVDTLTTDIPSDLLGERGKD